MYSILLIIHSWVRWIALAGGIGTTISRKESSGLLTMIALDLQMLLGLLLDLVVSPNMAEIRAHFGEAMQNPQLRFWAVEHITAMFVAIILAHVGNVMARKAADAQAAGKRRMIFFGLATLLMLVGMPWPWMAYGRPLFRL